MLEVAEFTTLLSSADEVEDVIIIVALDGIMLDVKLEACEVLEEDNRYDEDEPSEETTSLATLDEIADDTRDELYVPIFVVD